MKKVELNRESLTEFATYVNICMHENFQTESKTFLELLKFHLTCIQQKLFSKYPLLTIGGKRFVKVTFTYAEIITLAFVFKKVEVTSRLKYIEFNLIKGL
jgi:hypothetical protein